MRRNGAEKTSAEGWISPVDVTIIATWFSFDAISVVGFGDSLDMLRSEEYRWVPDA